MKNGKAKRTWSRIVKCVKEVIPSTTKTAIWIIKITVGVSFAILILKYFNLLPYISDLLSPVFNLFGLKGEAALAYVTGYFVNVYSAIAVMVTLDLDIRSITILATMVLCSHSMIVETAVQKKTGSSALRVVIARTLSAFILAFVLNRILPASDIIVMERETLLENPPFLTMLGDWCISTLKLVVKMIVLIFSLTIIQRLLGEFGVIKYISKALKPLMLMFGLPPRCSFLWIVANIIGLAYGAAAMLEESRRGVLSKEDINLLNAHIGISHSNFEDLLLLVSVGAVWWALLFSRWIMSMILVWEMRLEMWIKKKV